LTWALYRATGAVYTYVKWQE